jgi:predicted PurR-regulated permease PerM
MSDAPDDSEPNESGNDLTRFTGSLSGPLGVIAVATSGLLLLGIFYTLYVAKMFFLPVVLALLLDRLLSPYVRRLGRIGLPSPVGAAVVLLGLLGLFSLSVYHLSGPASRWVQEAPQHLRVAEYKLRGLKEPVEKMKKMAEQVDQATNVQSDGEEEGVQVREATVSEVFLGQTQALLTGGIVTFFLVYFLLASGDLFIRKLMRVLPRIEDRKKAVEIVRRTEGELSSYLFTMTAINLGLGASLAGVLWLIGLPNPLLWGAMAAVLNFVPYVGAIAGMVIIGLVALVTVDTVLAALVAPGSYAVLNFLESYLVTPFLLGQSFTLNPVAVFLALVFWGWIWGVMGAILAIPLLVSLKIVFDNVDFLSPLSEFLGS